MWLLKPRPPWPRSDPAMTRSSWVLPTPLASAMEQVKFASVYLAVASMEIPAAPEPPAGDSPQPTDTLAQEVKQGTRSRQHLMEPGFDPKACLELDISIQLMNEQSLFFSRQMETGLRALGKRAIMVAINRQGGLNRPQAQSACPKGVRAVLLIIGAPSGLPRGSPRALFLS